MLYLPFPAFSLSKKLVLPSLAAGFTYSSRFVPSYVIAM